MRAMARSPDGDATLVELKAVDGAYPLYGAVETEPPATYRRDCWRNAATCLARLPIRS